jgi:hypothetical protein
MGHHNPKHLKADVAEMGRLKLDDVLLAAQENDFAYFNGKLKFTPPIAKDCGLRPIVIFWGALNLFGGGRSSQFLLEHPEGFQVALDGSRRPQGCFVNPACVGRIEEMIDVAAECGFEGYFVDEPTPLSNCFCKSCRQKFEGWYGADLATASKGMQEEFRHRCCVDYVTAISAYCKAAHANLETMCCVMPRDSAMWEDMAAVPTLDNLGTDMYWVNNDFRIETMRPIVRSLGATCRKRGKKHHEWLQCCGVRAGREERILEQGKILVEEQPDALYVWAWEGQIGTVETCDDLKAAWAKACEVFRLARASRAS